MILMKKRSVSIVIPTFNGKELLRRFLPSVMAAAEAYHDGACEIILVDDASADASAEMIRSAFAGTRLVRLETHRGFAGACNAGFRACQNQIIILLNNDVLADRNFIAPLTAHFNDTAVFGVRPGLRLLDSKMSRDDLERFSIGLEFKRGLVELPVFKQAATPVPNDIFLLGGTSAAFDRQKLSELGGFDELFAPFYWEDADLSYRAWKRGWRILHEPQSLVYHQTHATIGRMYPRKYIEKISERNKYFLVWKNITDKKLLCYHACWIPLRLAGLLLSGRWHRLAAFFLALRELGKVSARRKHERQAAKVTDFQLFSFFAERRRGSTQVGRPA